MHLTNRQLKQLRAVAKLRTSSPTVAYYLRASWRGYLLLAITTGAAVAFFAWDGWPVLSGLFAGMFLAALLRDVRWFLIIAASWQLSREITDWDRVESLLAEADSRERDGTH